MKTTSARRGRVRVAPDGPLPKKKIGCGIANIKYSSQTDCVYVQVQSKTDSWGGSRYAPFHLVDPSLRVRPFSCAQNFGGSHMLFKRALADSLHKANGTIHSSDSVQVPRLSRFESALAFGLGGRNTHHCHRRPRMHLRHGACYTLNIYDYLLHCSPGPGPGTPPTSCRRSAMAAPCSRLRRRAM